MDRIELDNLTRTYYDAQGETFCALDHASLIWEQGHSIAIMGESGSGKSTLARLMIGLERPSEGRVLINGVDTTNGVCVNGENIGARSKRYFRMLAEH